MSEANEVERLVMCRWIGCNKPATLKIVRAGTTLCDEHYAANMEHFGCAFTTEPVNQKDT